MKITYLTTILQWGNNTAIQVSEEQLIELGEGKRLPVIVTIADYSYPSTIAVMDGMYLIPFAKEHREAVGVQGGDTLNVTVMLDTTSRKVLLPDDVERQVRAADVLGAYNTLAPSHQKEYVRSINDAKTEETRQRRVVKMIKDLKDR